MKKILSRIWKDPVWSKVISGGILTLIGTIYWVFESHLENISFIQAFNHAIFYKIDLWVIILLVLLIIAIYSLNKEFGRKRKTGSKSKVYNDFQINHDKELFKDIKEKVPPNGSIEFIRTNNFGGFSFSWNDLTDLDYVINNRNNPNIAFIDPELETIRKDFFNKVRNYRLYLASKAFIIDNDKRATVPPEWEENHPDRFREVIRKLHADAGEVCDIYDNFIHVGKHKFGL